MNNECDHHVINIKALEKIVFYAIFLSTVLEPSNSTSSSLSFSFPFTILTFYCHHCLHLFRRHRINPRNLHYFMKLPIIAGVTQTLSIPDRIEFI